MFEDFDEDDYDNSRHMNNRHYNSEDIREALYKVSDMISLQNCDEGGIDEETRRVYDELNSKISDCLELLEDL